MSLPSDDTNSTPMYLMVATALALIICIIIVYVLKFSKKEDKQQKTAAAASNNVAKGVTPDDTAYIASHISPTSTHWDILYYAATSPHNIEATTITLGKIQKLREEKLEKIEKQKEEDAKSNNFDLGGDDDGGWASDDDEEDMDEEAKAAAAAAKKHEEEVKLQKMKLAATMGKTDPTNIKFEGIDKGVIGEKWVTERLTQLRVWPPKIPQNASKILDASTGKEVAPLDHPAVKRNLLMIVGRINAIALNSHPELTKASLEGNLDQTYFRNTMEFRGRCAMILEASLGIATGTSCYPLTKTIVEAVSMFKIGVPNATNPKTIVWFKNLMTREYGGPSGVPNIQVSDLKIETEGEEQVATEDQSKLSLTLERTHAEAFTKHKVALCQKQGIPPQIALRSYREVWWILIRCKRTDGEMETDEITAKRQEILETNMKKILGDKYGSHSFKVEKGENRLIAAWPTVVNNISKAKGMIGVKFKAPSVPGTYDFTIDIMTQEFLGSNTTSTIKGVKIHDASKVQRKEKEEEVKNDEPKKDK